MNLVQEQHIALLEVGQDGGKVARTLHGRPAGGPQRGVHLCGHDVSQRGLAQTGRAAEQQVVCSRPPSASALKDQLQLGFDPGLTDELPQLSWPQ